MMKSYRCCIVIPLVNEVFTPQEIIAIQSLRRLDKQYPIYCIGTKDVFELNIMLLKSRLPDWEIGFVSFDARYFKSVQTYSHLLMTSHFYTQFIAFEYLLVFQTDAMIVRGDLTKFIQLDKVYIGAPWIDKNRATQKLLIGNGGLSLRKVDYFIEVTRLNSISLSKWWFKFPQQRFLRWGVVGLLFPLFYVLDVVVKVFGRSLFFDKMRLHSVAEDVSFARWLVQHHTDMPTLEEAVDFSFESNPRRCYEINNQRLPFGCHAWERYDLEFWQAHESQLKRQ